MLGQFAFGLWIAAVTLGGIYFGQSVFPAPKEQVVLRAHAGDGTGEYRTDLFAIPHVDENGIAGYLTGRFAFKFDPVQVSASGIPLETLIFDSLSRHFYSEAGSFATADGWERLRDSLEELRAAANATAGREVVAEVLIEQLDYFPKQDVRTGDERGFQPAEDE